MTSSRDERRRDFISLGLVNGRWPTRLAVFPRSLGGVPAATKSSLLHEHTDGDSLADAVPNGRGEIGAEKDSSPTWHSPKSACGTINAYFRHSGSMYLREATLGALK